MKTKAELIVPGELKDEAIICYLCKKFDLTISILEVSFSTDTGWAILTFDGAKEEIERALTYLKEKGVEIKKAEPAS